MTNPDISNPADTEKSTGRGKKTSWSIARIISQAHLLK